MTLLSICENACDEVGLTRPSSIIGSSDATARRCLRYAIRTGKEFVKENHPLLTKEHTFPTVASTEAYAPPSDFDHFVPFTHWNRTTDRRLHPIQPGEWQQYESGLVTVTIDDRFRIRGADGEILIYPTPSSVETLSYEYISENYCESTIGTGQNVWTTDTDVGVIDEELFELGVIWRLLNRMGMPYAEEKSEYQDNMRTQLSQTLPQKLRTDGHIPASQNIPESDFPSS